MIVRTLEEITGTDRQIDSDHWTSKRIVLSDDNVGFSYHETTVAAGTRTPLHYPDYIEAVWLIEGHGQLLDRDNNTTYPLAPGTMYLLDKHERHTIIAETQLRMYCVFAPAVPPGSD
ncbi:ectoine synthase [Nocardia donostiensis]|uniref:L-ectoine synthase n=1 Tax=Nocardia donostiensis TaxID=1538463 RepID=A0A1V2TKH9_9NOCA|nr:ectoine synthase [Nocardia donostiensis]ONM49851.1 L-ectoine synthase [Nocardia donostiensis]OQS12715.1 L-ectoine synthase [Nocardia donostiensis]OQS22199.1 L-ectoine synthase [Nocardia donostiensis]